MFLKEKKMKKCFSAKGLFLFPAIAVFLLTHSACNSDDPTEEAPQTYNVSASKLPPIQITKNEGVTIVELKGSSILSDNSSNEENATLISKSGSLEFEGYGKLIISGAAKHTIASSKQSITVRGGDITVTAAASDGFAEQFKSKAVKLPTEEGVYQPTATSQFAAAFSTSQPPEPERFIQLKQARLIHTRQLA
jgi:hypothetical protein